MTTPDRPTQVLVVGAGYAGVLAANRMAGRGLHVTLVNDRDVFVDRIRLHEVIAGTRSAKRTARRLKSMLSKRVQLEIGRAVAVGESEESAWVRIQDGRVLSAAHVLISTGSGARSGGWGWALNHRDMVVALPDGASVVVAGGGFTGIEVASEIAGARPDLRVALVDPAGVGRSFSQAGRRYLLASLDGLGIELGQPAMVDLTVDCTGFTLPPLACDSGLPVADDGAIVVEDTLRVRGRNRLWAAGDAARVAGQPHLRMACASAEPMAAHAADQILRQLRSEALQPLSLGFGAQCLSLGRHDALLQIVDRDDTAKARIVTGRPAVWAKTALCWAAAAAPQRFSRHYAALAGPQPPKLDKDPLTR